MPGGCGGRTRRWSPPAYAGAPDRPGASRGTRPPTRRRCAPAPGAGSPPPAACPARAGAGHVGAEDAANGPRWPHSAPRAAPAPLTPGGAPRGAPGSRPTPAGRPPTVWPPSDRSPPTPPSGLPRPPTHTRAAGRAADPRSPPPTGPTAAPPISGDTRSARRTRPTAAPSPPSSPAHTAPASLRHTHPHSSDSPRLLPGSLFGNPFMRLRPLLR